MWQNVFEQTGLLRKYISIIAKYKLKKKTRSSEISVR